MKKNPAAAGFFLSVLLKSYIEILRRSYEAY